MRRSSRHTKAFQVTLFLLAFLGVAISSSSAAPLEIRFTAATFSFMSDSIPNTTFQYAASKTGFDIVWRGQLVGSTFIPDAQPLVLKATGNAEAQYSNGVGSCTSVLSQQPGGSLLPQIREVSGTTVKMKISLPHTAANNGTTAFIMDGAQSAPDCRVAKNPFLQGSNVISSCVFSPMFDTPGGPTSCVAHGTDAYFEFSSISRSFNSPFTFTFDATEYSQPGGAGSILRHHKIVWFGAVSVRPAKGDTTPAPYDPFTFYGYVPPGSLQDAPPDGPTPSAPGGDYDPRDILRWYTGMWGNVRDGINSVRSSLVGPRRRARTAAATEFSFDAASGVLVIPLAVLEAVPHSGKLKMHLTLKKPEKAAGFQAKVARGAMSNELLAGSPSDLRIKLPKATQRSLASGKRFRAFLAFEFSPERGKKAKKVFKFNIKKVKRN